MRIEVVTDGIPTGNGDEILRGPEILRILVLDQLDLLEKEEADVIDVVFNSHNGELYALIKYKKNEKSKI